MTDNVLHGFKLLPQTYAYAKLHKKLWPTSAPGGQGDSALPLQTFMRTCQPDLRIWTNKKRSDKAATSVDVDESEQPLPASAIRYIDLHEHPFFCVHTLGDPKMPSKIIVRQEYLNFLDDASRSSQDRFFLTGQPGIGKSLGACYFLFHLLASGKSIFFQPEEDILYYFSQAGVGQRRVLKVDWGHPSVGAALQNSWVLIDAESTKKDWLPGVWPAKAGHIVWTSSPQVYRMHHFCKNRSATPWIMKYWSLEEIAAQTKLAEIPPSTVLERLERHGPVARDLFHDPRAVSDLQIERNLQTVLERDPFYLSFAELNVQDASHQLFLIQPLLVLNEDGTLCSVNRQEESVDFLSRHITNLAAKVVETHFDRMRGFLADVFNGTPATQRTAGLLVEAMFHRALVEQHTIDPQQAFGVPRVTEQLTLLGTAKDFLLASHHKSKKDCRPLYLWPHSRNFAAVNSILVTYESVFLIQPAVGTYHSFTVPTLLRILARIQHRKIKVDKLRPVYCLVGMDTERVQELMKSASAKLNELKENPRAKELEAVPKNARRRLKELEVAGVTFKSDGTQQWLEVVRADDIEESRKRPRKRRKGS